jgi:mono/diheme cytochrome c family protein
MSRRNVLIALVAIVALAVGAFVWIAGGPGPMGFASGPKVTLADYRGADPTGVPVSLKNASLVQRGEYLVHAADCSACHTARGGKPFAGGLAFHLPFGTIYSPNITPDKDTGIGGWSDADFLRALHQGRDDEKAPLYPAMPYASYTYMTDADALAIKAYLFSLAPVHADTPPDALAFPFNQRWLMGVWTSLFDADKRFEPDTSRSAEWNRGAYIAEALAHCGECHTPRNPAFALNNRRKFAGAVTAGWRAYNITSDKASGVGGWSDDDLFTYLSTGHAAGHGTASGPMGEAVDLSLSKMAPEDVHAVVAYLRTIPAISSPDSLMLAPTAPDSHREGAAVADGRGKQVFAQACASCHSWSGVSPVLPFATLTGARAVNDSSAVNVAQIVITGTRRITPQGAVVMPAFGNTYSDAEIAAVANYVTARFGSKGSAITERRVASLRQQASQ